MPSKIQEHFYAFTGLDWNSDCFMGAAASAGEDLYSTYSPGRSRLPQPPADFTLRIAQNLIYAGIGMYCKFLSIAACSSLFWLAIQPACLMARVKQLTMAPSVSPAFGGISFGSVGRYEVLKGTAIGELDPSDSLNAGIVNLDRAPRNGRGFVEYRVNVTILKPIDLSRGNRRMFYEIANRGSKLANFWVNSGELGEPSWGAEDDLGTAFLMSEGYTVVWSGWQGDAAFGMYAQLPIPTDNGQPIVGISRDEYTDTGTNSTFTKTLAYPAANRNAAEAFLTVRERESDARVPLASWQYNSEGTQITITRPPGYDSGAIYEFIYPARNPTVMGIGFAAIRDVVSHLRYEIADEGGNLNPLMIEDRPAVEKAYAFGVSQSGRVLRDLVHQGFNEDESHRITFDGAFALLAGSKKSFTNYEFAQPGRTQRQHEEHLFPGDQFPFSYGVTLDRISGRIDGILSACEGNGTCPKIMHIDSENEIWQARGSLVVTGTSGTADLILPENVRAYLFAGTQHQPGGAPARGICRQLSNPLDYRPFIRALIAAMDEWTTTGTVPPPSRYASLADGTLVFPSRPERARDCIRRIAHNRGRICRPAPLSLRFPAIPEVNYSGLVNSLHWVDYGTQPPTRAGAGAYPVWVAAADEDGNSIAGIRHPFLQVPRGTFTGWNLRSDGNALNELCSLTGSYLPFAGAAADRIALGDPRPSIEERYQSHDAYVSLVGDAAEALRQQRLLLEEDVARIIEEAEMQALGSGPKPSSSRAAPLPRPQSRSILPPTRR